MAAITFITPSYQELEAKLNESSKQQEVIDLADGPRTGTCPHIRYVWGRIVLVQGKEGQGQGRIFWGAKPGMHSCYMYTSFT